MSALPSSEKHTCPPVYTSVPHTIVNCPSEIIAHRQIPANDNISRSSLSSFIGANDYRAIHEIPPTTISPSLLRVARTHDRTPFDFPAYPFIHQGAHLSPSGGHGGPEITIPTAGGVMFPAAFQGQNGCLQSTATVYSPFQAQQPFALQRAKEEHNVRFNHDDLLFPNGNQASSSQKNRPTHRSVVEDVKGPLEIVIHDVSPVRQRKKTSTSQRSLVEGAKGPLEIVVYDVSPARERKKTGTSAAASVDSLIDSSPGSFPRVRRQGMRRDLQDWKDTKPSSSDPAAVGVRAGAKRLDVVDGTTSSRPSKKTKRSPKTSSAPTAGSNGPLSGEERVNHQGKRWDLVGYKVDHVETNPPSATERVSRQGMRCDLLDSRADRVKTSSASTSTRKTTRTRRHQS